MPLSSSKPALEMIARVGPEDLSYAILAAMRMWQHERHPRTPKTPRNPQDRIIREAVFGQVIDGRRWTIRVGDAEYVVSVRHRRGLPR